MARVRRDSPLNDAEVAHHLQEQIQQLATAVQALDLQQQGEYNIDEDNSLAEDQEDLRLEQGFKFELPEFHGSSEELIDWIVTVEETLEFKSVPLERCVPMIAMRFRGRAAAWWTQLKTSRATLGKPKISSWDNLKKKMRKAFVLSSKYDPVMLQRLQKLRQGEDSVEKYSAQFFSLLTSVDLQDSDQQIVAHFVGGLRRRIRDHLKLSKPFTVSEAHQQALSVEALEAQITKDSNHDIWTVFALCISITTCVFIVGCR